MIICFSHITYPPLLDQMFLLIQTPKYPRLDLHSVFFVPPAHFRYKHYLLPSGNSFLNKSVSESDTLLYCLSFQFFLFFWFFTFLLLFLLSTVVRSSFFCSLLFKSGFIFLSCFQLFCFCIIMICIIRQML